MSVEAGSVKLEEGMAVIRIPLSEVHGLRVAFWIDGEPVSWNETTGEVEKYKVLRFRDGSGIGGNYDPALSAFPSLWTAAHRLQNQATFLSVRCDPSDEDLAKVFSKSPNTHVQVEVRGSLVRNIAGDLTYTENAGLCTRDLMTHPDGWNIPLARLNDTSWSSFVSMCFQSVPLASEGTEARYRLAGYCSLQDPLKNTTPRMLATCDEQIYETADGDIGIIDG